MNLIRYKYVILGGGPSGLTVAAMLDRRGERSYILIEKEEEVGGLCRSTEVDGSPFDIGGGHFLDVRRPEVTDFVFEYLPKDEWNYFERDSRIRFGDNELSHPFEANIWQLSSELQEEYLESIKEAGCNTGEPAPDKFIDWIYWKLGNRIALDYMIPYNRKMFSDELNELGTYWLEKLPNVDYEDTLKSCREHRAYGKQPGHAYFYYPKKYGYGRIWTEIGNSLKGTVACGISAEKLDVDAGRVVLSDGTVIEAEKIIVTVPWQSFERIEGVSKENIEGIATLKSSSIETRYFDENIDTAAQWIYYPDESLPYHRILVRHNFAIGSRGYWTETRAERCGMFKSGEGKFSYLNEYAYPLNSIGKNDTVRRLLDECAKHNVFGLGRWGEHSHFNSDVVVARAMEMSEKI